MFETSLPLCMLACLHEDCSKWLNENKRRNHRVLPTCITFAVWKSSLKTTEMTKAEHHKTSVVLINEDFAGFGEKALKNPD